MSSGTLDNHIKQRHKHLYHRYLADQAEEYRLRRRNATTSADVGEDTQPQKRKTSPFRYSVESLTFKALDHVRTLKATKSKAYDVEEPKIDEETGEVETFLPNHIKDRTVKVEMGPRRATAATWRTEVHPMMKEGDDLKDVPDDQRQNTARPDDDDFNPFQPFLNGYDFKLARWFIKNRIPDTVINDYFNSGIGKDVRSFQSAYTLNKLVDEMDFGIWNEGLAIFQVDAKNSHQKYYTRKLISCIRTLVEQPCYRDYMTYFPYKEYQFQDDVEERVFSEIFSADWCWEEQVST